MNVPARKIVMSADKLRIPQNRQHPPILSYGTDIVTVHTDRDHYDTHHIQLRNQYMRNNFQVTYIEENIIPHKVTWYPEHHAVVDISKQTAQAVIATFFDTRYYEFRQCSNLLEKRFILHALLRRMADRFLHNLIMWSEAREIDELLIEFTLHNERNAGMMEVFDLVKDYHEEIEIHAYDHRDLYATILKEVM